MKYTKLFYLTFFLLTLNLSFGQSYIGHSVDNYSGIHGVIYNPSSIVGSNLRADINLISGSVFGGSDYFGINLGDILSSEGGFDFEEVTKTYPSNANNFFVNADVVLPSFMFNLNKKSSIGLVTRVRANQILNNISGELFENISDDIDADEDYSFKLKDLNGTVHAWAEVGLAYGRILIEKPNHLLKGGVTLKYLQGAGGVFVSSPTLQGQYTASSETLTTEGFLNYGTSQDFDSDDIDFSDLTAGFGLDVGFTYQWYSNRDNDSIPNYSTPYKVKVGVSVTDIGSINYENSIMNTYDLDATVSTADSEDDIQDFLDNNYDGVETKGDAKIKLPTALHLLVDYRLTKKWFVSAQADVSIVKKGALMSGSIINTVTLAPRLETKWFSFYAPLSFRQYGDTSFGGGIRVGPLTVGSGSVFTNLLSDNSKTTDVYLGFNVPLFRK